MRVDAFADDESDDARPHLLLFTTPSRLYGLIDALDVLHDESRSPADWLAADSSLFDFLAIDEASMMRLPSFLMCHAFLAPHAQVLIAGDHRQLPPVRHHDWATERRRTVVDWQSALSTLEWFRAVTGHPVDRLDDESRIAGQADLPWYQLDTTYRCHPDVAGLLHRHVYAADGIPFHAHTARKLHPISTAVRPVATALDPAYPLVLVVHGERESQRVNVAETAIASTLVQAVDPRDRTGIVTPHNAQRGLLNAVLDDETEVDTVERFQGGERDCIVVSATASDPDFLAAEQDFILNPNRLNVAMSRMKRKLIVMASEAVFDLMPPEVEAYERAGLWKALYAGLRVVAAAPAWRVALGDMVSSSSPADNADVPVAIYRFDPAEGT
jgi:superfamily I DNA and/or RNA helicase